MSAGTSRVTQLWDARNALSLLVVRDLKVKYEGSFLGWIWSVLEPLLMAGVYWFVFTQIFERTVGAEPYILFLISVLLPWNWVNGVLSASPRALTSEVKLVRSINLPREMWVLRVVATKGAEYVLSLPVLLFFSLYYLQAPTLYILLFPLAFALQAILLLGIGLLFASLTVVVPDVQRLIRVMTRLLFYASPIIYGFGDIPENYRWVAMLNPFMGILELYRAAWFPEEFDSISALPLVGTAAIISFVVLGLGWFTFTRLESLVLKEISMSSPLAPDAQSTADEPVERIVVDDVGIRFQKGRKKSRSVRDVMFKGRDSAPAPNEFWALRNISFTVGHGEAVGVVGSNGQGKSTLLKIIAGVLLPDEGAVTVNGGVAPLIEVTGGFVGQLTGRDNVYLTAGLHGMSKAEIDNRFDDIVEFSGIGDFIDMPFRHYSSGMRVRLGFSVITTLDEPVVLIDEVLAVGDREFRRKCYTRMEQLLSEDRTVFMVSHSERDLKRFCTRGVYLRKGTLVADGPIGDVLDQYTQDSAT